VHEPLQFLLITPVFECEPAFFQGFVHGSTDDQQIKRFREIVACPQLERIDGGRQVQYSRDHDYRNIRIVTLDEAQEFEPGHSRHAHIAHDDGKAVFSDFLEGVGRIGRGDAFARCVRKAAHEQRADLRLVIHNKYLVEKYLVEKSSIFHHDYPARADSNFVLRVSISRITW
jgi:hypothetical protein